MRKALLSVLLAAVALAPPLPMRRATTISYTSDGVQQWAPAGANGVSVTPNGTSWAASAWVEVTASTSEAWLLTGLSINHANDQQWVVEVGVGAAGAEAVIASFTGHLGTSLGMEFYPAEIPIDAIPASSRVAVRIKKFSTGTTAWTIAVGYLPKSAAGNVISTTTPSELLPVAGTNNPTVTSGGSAWSSGAWVQLTASSSGRYVITGLGVAGSCGLNYQEWELDIGKGAAASEVVVTTVRFGAYWIGNDSGYVTITPPIDNIPASTRIAVRSRSSIASCQVYPRLKYHEDPEAAVSALVTTKPQKFTPAAAVGINHVSGTSAWTYNSWTEQIASTSATIGLVGIFTNSTESGPNEGIELEIGTGGAGAETGITMQRFAVGSNVPQGNYGWIPWRIGKNGIPASTRVAIRERDANVSVTTIPVVLGYLEDPDSGQMHPNAMHVGYPSAANNLFWTLSATPWTSSSWQQLVASLPSDFLLTNLAIGYVGTANQVEVDIGTGASSSEVVATTFRFRHRDGNKKGVVWLPVPRLFTAGTRLSARARGQQASINLHIGVTGVLGDILSSGGWFQNPILICCEKPGRWRN